MENIKICNRCKEEKNVSEFYLRRNREGIISNCKNCCKQIYQENKDGRIKIWKEKNAEEIKRKARERSIKDRDKNSKKNKERWKNLSPEDKKKHCQKTSEGRRNNPERKARAYAYNIEYKKKHKAHLVKKRAERAKERYHNDLDYRLVVLLKCRLYKAVKRERVKSATVLLGCTSEELKSHLSAKWRCGMSWENYGRVWDIDHILPIDSFNLTIPEEQEKCFHYTNLQPLFKTRKIALEHGCDEIGNIEKKNKII